MTANAEELELKDRIRLIESMIAEGRRTTESWGWTFLLWGVAYYVAIAWSIWGPQRSLAWLAWPVTMIAASVLTGVFASRQKRSSPNTTLGRALSSIWIAMGVSIFIVTMCLATSGRYDLHIFVAIVAAMLGVANGASGMIIRWKAQIASAFVWWAATVAACFGSDDQCTVVFLVAIFFCQIVFGFYAMICESRLRKQQEVSHA